MTREDKLRAHLEELQQARILLDMEIAEVTMMLFASKLGIIKLIGEIGENTTAAENHVPCH